ncbi:PREDICTED: uncharacterized protein LOC105447920 [Wasmannia auropunctata]|uniref:uncharacterized protein LOC105447920 n=1 Tax=Wasmannia auropunctata TaxID=64793 RepID=UPI0005EF2AAE|nr:PREDICTED: uncharacterized protein LOC105447920 [Wasmannia auropunctata]
MRLCNTTQTIWRLRLHMEKKKSPIRARPKYKPYLSPELSGICCKVVPRRKHSTDYRKAGTKAPKTHYLVSPVLHAEIAKLVRLRSTWPQLATSMRHPQFIAFS